MTLDSKNLRSSKLKEMKQISMITLRAVLIYNLIRRVQSRIEVALRFRKYYLTKLLIHKELKKMIQWFTKDKVQACLRPP
jgi:hypothetical protein